MKEAGGRRPNRQSIAAIRPSILVIAKPIALSDMPEGMKRRSPTRTAALTLAARAGSPSMTSNRAFACVGAPSPTTSGRRSRGGEPGHKGSRGALGPGETAERCEAVGTPGSVQEGRTNAQFGRLNPAQGNLPRFLKLGLNLQF